MRSRASVQFSSIVWLFATPRTAARQASLSITNSQSSLKLMSIELMMPSNHLILCSPHLLLPSISPATGSFPVSQFLTTDGQSIGASDSASSIIQDWFPLGLTGSIFLQSKQLWRVFNNTAVQKHGFTGAQLSLLSNSHIHTWLMEKA